MRPITVKLKFDQTDVRSPPMSGPNSKGRKNWVGLPAAIGPSSLPPMRKLAGNTPITRASPPGAPTVRPITRGSPLNADRHSASVMTIGRLLSAASAGAKNRPSSGLVSSTSKKFGVTRTPSRTCGTPCPTRVTEVLCSAAIASNSLACSRQARNADGVFKSWYFSDSCGICGARSPTSTSCCGLGRGSGRSSTPFTTEKMAVVAPTPTANMTTTTM